jgi:hypothetical protein
MTQAGPQFTAAQILEAGRRAEADGRIDYAIQFYRHLTDHLPRAPETAAAREALARIAQWRAGEAAGGPAPPGGSVNGHPAAGRQQHSALSAQQQPGTRPEPHPAAPAGQGRQGGLSIAPAGARREGTVELPRPRDRYRLGRSIARLTSAIGWISMALGIVALVLLVAGRTTGLPRAAGIDIAGMVLASGGIGAPVLLVSGLVLIFWGQLARAVFDNANATRELVAIERARAGEIEP